MTSRRPTPPASRAEHVAVDTMTLPAFGLADELRAFDGDWHSHRFHQLLYAASGALRLETDEGTWLLPPQRAAWICAGVRHRVAARQPVALRTVYLARRLAPAPPFRCRVFAASPLAREMILHATRWDHRRSTHDDTARAYFRALAALGLEWASSPGPFHLPAPRSDELRRALAWLHDHLDQPVTAAQLARVSGSSLRTLARRLDAELGLSFRDYLRAARMLRAVELLAAPTARVTEVALAVGFSSPSAFTAAFVAFLGEPPRDFRKAHIDRASP